MYGGVLIIMHDRSRMTIDPRIPSVPELTTSGFWVVGVIKEDERGFASATCEYAHAHTIASIPLEAWYGSSRSTTYIRCCQSKGVEPNVLCVAASVTAVATI